jgi:hypothetical protein
MFPTRPHLRPGLTVALAAILPVRRVTFAGGEARSRTRREPVPSEEVTTDLWKIWTEAACTLDVPDCDWHTLQRVEQLLRLLSSELVGLSQPSTPVRRMAPAIDERPQPSAASGERSPGSAGMSMTPSNQSSRRSSPLPCCSRWARSTLWSNSGSSNRCQKRKTGNGRGDAGSEWRGI